MAKPRVSIRETTYRGQKGYLVTEAAPGGGGSRIFVPTKKMAEEVREAVRAGDQERISQILLRGPKNPQSKVVRANPDWVKPLVEGAAFAAGTFAFNAAQAKTSTAAKYSGGGRAQAQEIEETQQNPVPRRSSPTGGAGKPTVAQRLASGQWAKAGRQGGKPVYQHASGAKVVYRPSRFLWEVVGGRNDGHAYERQWAALDAVEQGVRSNPARQRQGDRPIRLTKPQVKRLERLLQEEDLRGIGAPQRAFLAGDAAREAVVKAVMEHLRSERYSASQRGDAAARERLSTARDLIADRLQALGYYGSDFINPQRRNPSRACPNCGRPIGRVLANPGYCSNCNAQVQVHR